jgi:hypothetical protein
LHLNESDLLGELFGMTVGAARMANKFSEKRSRIRLTLRNAEKANGLA